MKIRVFISSVQKELADERLALQILLSSDPFLSLHCVPILFEQYPAPLEPQKQAYLELLESCHVYVGVIWKQYGDLVDGLSATHHEYRYARQADKPCLITIKGQNSVQREKNTENFIDEIKADGHTYNRFENTEELQNRVRERLVKHINDHYHIEPTAEQEKVARQTIRIASAFERQRLELIEWERLDKALALEMAAKAEDRQPDLMDEAEVRFTLWTRGYLWQDGINRFYGTAAGIMLLYKNPGAVFPHARIQIAAYAGLERTHSPIDHATISLPIPQAIDACISFIKKNTRHPLRIAGLKRIEVDEYPERAIREALVNALAHRNYEDAARKVTVDLFRDRLEIWSPGGLPPGLTLRSLKTGQAKSRSRNPGIAQGLSILGLMEERGTGIQRMKIAMLNHGLEEPVIELKEDELVVTLPGPGDDMDRIRVEDSHTGLPASLEDKLNERQKKILEEAVQNGKVTAGWVRDAFGVSKNTATRDLAELCDWSLLERVGIRGGSYYMVKT